MWGGVWGWTSQALPISEKEFPQARRRHVIGHERHAAEPSCPEPQTIANLNRQITVFYRKEAHLLCLWECVYVCVCVGLWHSHSSLPLIQQPLALLNIPWSVAMAFTSPSPSVPSSPLPNSAHRDDCPFIKGECLCASVYLCVSLHHNWVLKILIWKTHTKKYCKQASKTGLSPRAWRRGVNVTAYRLFVCECTCVVCRSRTGTYAHRCSHSDSSICTSLRFERFGCEKMQDVHNWVYQLSHFFYVEPALLCVCTFWVLLSYIMKPVIPLAIVLVCNFAPWYHNTACCQVLPQWLCSTYINWEPG